MTCQAIKMNSKEFFARVTAASAEGERSNLSGLRRHNVNLANRGNFN
jgi:hypothetical protein